jgi:hypothetical protein
MQRPGTVSASPPEGNEMLTTKLQPALRVLAALVFCAAIGAATARADGGGISLDIQSSTLTASVDGTVTFTGTITNNSGAPLNASDFFFNFFGFDPALLTPVQDLGVASDFTIANGSTSSITALFDVLLGNAAPGAKLPFGVDLEDANGDLTGTIDLQVDVAGSSTGTGGSGGNGGSGGKVPEPATNWLFACGALALALGRNRLARTRS